MSHGRLLERYLLSQKSERPIGGILRNFVYTIIFTFLVLTVRWMYHEMTGLNEIKGLILLNASIFYFGWGAERLWYATISKMLKDPFSLIAYITRIPFWIIIGGSGFSLASLLIYKLKLLYFVIAFDQYELFLLGGLMQFLLQIPLQIFTYQSLLKKIPIKE